MDATGNSPPSPAPIRKRSTISTARLVAKALSPLAIENSSSVAMNTRRRPTLSAHMPKATAPTAMPMELMLPSQPICAGVSDQLTLSAASTKANRPTSMASNSQAVPETNSRRLRLSGTESELAGVGAGAGVMAGLWNKAGMAAR